MAGWFASKSLANGAGKAANLKTEVRATGLVNWSEPPKRDKIKWDRIQRMEKEFPMGRRKQRLFEARFKEEAVRRMLNGESIMRLSRELDVARAVLYRWRDTYRAEGLAGLERRRGRPRPGQQVVSLKSRDPAAERIAELERLVGKQAAELDFFERAFGALQLARPSSNARTASSSTRLSTKSAPKADSASNKPASSRE